MQVIQSRNLQQVYNNNDGTFEEDDRNEQMGSSTVGKFPIPVCVEGGSQFFGMEHEMEEGYPDGIWVYADGECEYARSFSYLAGCLARHTGCTFPGRIFFLSLPSIWQKDCKCTS
jgi:hypothetical protein